MYSLDQIIYNYISSEFERSSAVEINFPVSTGYVYYVDLSGIVCFKYDSEGINFFVNRFIYENAILMFSLGYDDRNVISVFELWFKNLFKITEICVRPSDFYRQRVINGRPSQEMLK